MDPVTAALQLANTVLLLAIRIYDDTPLEIRQKNIEKWDKRLERAERFLETGKLAANRGKSAANSVPRKRLARVKAK